MARIFISHSSKDNFEAIAFKMWLISEGWAEDDIFLDLDGIGAGERWKSALAKANDRCEAVIFLVSPHSLASNECYVEIRMAEDNGKIILPTILPARDPKEAIALDDPRLNPYRDLQIVDISAVPREAETTINVEHGGEKRAVTFHAPTLARLKGRLEQLGVSPTSFAWNPRDLTKASPYPGLEGFSSDEASLFFGRSADISRAISELRKLRRHALNGNRGEIFVIQAASGAGKSSFLKAGLWPRLSRGREFAPLAILRPATGILSGNSGLGRTLSAYFARHKRSIPAAEIHGALLSDDGDAGAKLIEFLNEATTLAHQSQRATDPDAIVPTPVIAVDQAEELFAAADREQSDRFLTLVKRMTTSAPDDRLVAAPLVILTIRADSMDALLHAVSDYALRPPMPFPLPPIGRDAYREVIDRPMLVANAKGMKLSLEPELTDHLVKGATGADALPLLSHTLQQLVEDNRSGSRAHLTLPGFLAGGGMEGVIRRRLDVALQTASASNEDLRRLLLPQLATWDPDADPPGAKRSVATELLLFADGRSDLVPLADALEHERILTRGGGDDGTEKTLEIAHEALLRQEPISDWLEQDREFLIWRDATERARKEYDANKRGLLVGRELEIASAWLEERGPRDEIAKPELEFVLASKAADEARRRDAAERERRIQAEKLAAAQKTARRTVAGIIATSVLAIVAVVFGSWALQGQISLIEANRVSEERAEDAERLLRDAQISGSRYLSERSAVAKTAHDPTTAALLALHALPDLARSQYDTAPPPRPTVDSAIKALNFAVYELRESHSLGFATGFQNTIVASSDGTQLATFELVPPGSKDAEEDLDPFHRDSAAIDIWDIETGRIASSLRIGGEQHVRPKVVLHGASQKLYSIYQGAIEVWDYQSREQLRLIDHPNDDPFVDLELTYDGGTLFALTDNGKLFRRHGPAMGLSNSLNLDEHLPEADSQVTAFRKAVGYSSYGQLTISPSGRSAAVYNGFSRQLIFWDTTNNSVETRVIEGLKTDGLIALHPNGTTVAALSGGVLYIWDTKANKVRKADSEARFSARNMEFSEGGASLTLLDYFAITILDFQTLKVVNKLDLPSMPSIFSGDGTDIVASRSAVAISVENGGLRLLNLSSSTQSRRNLSSSTQSRRIPSAGEKLVAGEFLGASRLFLAFDDGRIEVRRGGGAGSIEVKRRPKRFGRTIFLDPSGGGYIGGSDILRGMFVTFRESESKKLYTDGLIGAGAFSLDGRFAITMPENGTRLALLNGGSAVLASDLAKPQQNATIWGQPFPTLVREVGPHDSPLTAVALAPDGTIAATATYAGEVSIWRLAEEPQRQTLPQRASAVTALGFVVSHKFLAIGYADGTLRLWDVDASKLRAEVKAHDGAVRSVSVASERRVVMTVGLDRVARLWSLDSGSLVGELVGRGLGVETGFINSSGTQAVTGSTNGSMDLWKTWPDVHLLIDYTRRAVPRCLTQAQLKEFYLPPEPPRWCITGPGHEAEPDSTKWQPKWPYHSPEWREWLVKADAARAAGDEPPDLPVTIK